MFRQSSADDERQVGPDDRLQPQIAAGSQVMHTSRATFRAISQRRLRMLRRSIPPAGPSTGRALYRGPRMPQEPQEALGVHPRLRQRVAEKMRSIAGTVLLHTLNVKHPKVFGPCW